jgi:phosphate acetyltransferase
MTATQNLYIASIEPGCGKSIVSLGICELMSRQFRTIGCFRPIISDREGRDAHVELLRTRYCAHRPYESLYGVSHETARQRSDAGQMEMLLGEIDRRYEALRSDCEIVICEGTDHTELASPFDFEFEARLAQRLACRMVLVTSGRRRPAADAADVACAAHDAVTRLGCRVVATVISRVRGEDVEAVRTRLTDRHADARATFVIPECPSLAKPTAGQIASAVGAQPLFVEPHAKQVPVEVVRVAAMQLTHFLNYVHHHSLVLTPGDRTDVILALLASHTARTYPDIAGLILTGNLTPEPDVKRLLEGLRPLPVPIYLTDDDTYTTAMKIHAARPTMTHLDQQRIAAALQLFAASTQPEILKQALLNEPA